LLTLLEEGKLGPEPLARALFVSERTLRRKLAAHGTSYQDLLDEVRRSLALGRVAHEETGFEQLAAALGFADTSSSIAFKRWTGTTPPSIDARRRCVEAVKSARVTNPHQRRAHRATSAQRPR